MNGWNLQCCLEGGVNGQEEASVHANEDDVSESCEIRMREAEGNMLFMRKTIHELTRVG